MHDVTTLGSQRCSAACSYLLHGRIGDNMLAKPAVSSRQSAHDEPIPCGLALLDFDTWLA